MRKGVTQKLKQWETGDGSVQITPFKPQILRPVLSLLDVPLFFHIHSTVLVLRFYMELPPHYIASENERETKQIKGVIPCCN